MIKLKKTLQNGKEIKLEGRAQRDTFATFTDFLDYTYYVETMLSAEKKELTYIVEYEK